MQVYACSWLELSYYYKWDHQSVILLAFQLRMGVQTDQVNRRSFISFVCSPLPCLLFRKSDFHVAAGDAQGTDVEKSLSSIRRMFEPLLQHPLVICQFIFRRLSHRDAWNFMPDFLRTTFNERFNDCVRTVPSEIRKRCACWRCADATVGVITRRP